MDRGERPTKLSDSWLSAKSISVERRERAARVENGIEWDRAPIGARQFATISEYGKYCISRQWDSRREGLESRGKQP